MAGKHSPRAWLDNGDVLSLDPGKPLGQGGEARVVRVVGRREVVAKLYHQPTAARAAKLDHLLAARPVGANAAPDVATVAWPLARLNDRTGQAIGYLMPAVHNALELAAVYHPGARAGGQASGWDLRHLVMVAVHLARALVGVHQVPGMAVGDLNDRNILVRSDARVIIIDCDSFTIGPFNSGVGRVDYLAPELQLRLGSARQGQQQDAFSLAILLYQLLMGGMHPFAGGGEPASLAERIAAGHYPHRAGGPAAPLAAPTYDTLPDALRDLFDRAFIDGHGTPARRPTARVWARALVAAGRHVQRCPVDGAHHRFAQSGCATCARAARATRGRGNGAARRARRTRNAPPGTPTAGAQAGQYAAAAGPGPTAPRPPVAVRPGRWIAVLIILGVAVATGYLLSGQNTASPPQPYLGALAPDSDRVIGRTARHPQDERLDSGSDIYRRHLQ